MTIKRITKEADIARIAPLVAQFRVTLKAFKGVEAAPDEAAADEELRSFLQEGFPVFAAEKDGAVCGYLVCRVDEPCVWVEQLFVLPACRRQGIAGALFDRAEALAASYGEETVYNYIHPNNAAIVAFLKSRGYNVLNLIEIRKPYAGETLTREVRVDEHRFDY